ncbi:MAG: twin-arginine translocase TatA/TatE family subunit [Sodaliphilus sp.]
MTLLFIGTTELLLIGGVALLFFGGKKLPEMMRGLGQGVRQFKEGMSEIKNADSDAPENAEETEANEQHPGESDKNQTPQSSNTVEDSEKQ